MQVQEHKPITIPFRPCETYATCIYQGIQYQYHIISFPISLCLIWIIIYKSISHIESNVIHMYHVNISYRVNISCNSHIHVWCFINISSSNIHNSYTMNYNNQHHHIPHTTHIAHKKVFTHNYLNITSLSMHICTPINHHIWIIKILVLPTYRSEFKIP